MSLQPREQPALPVRFGGIRHQKATDIGLSAYISLMASSADLVGIILHREFTQSTPTYVLHAWTHRHAILNRMAADWKMQLKWFQCAVCQETGCFGAISSRNFNQQVVGCRLQGIRGLAYGIASHGIASRRNWKSPRRTQLQNSKCTAVRCRTLRQVHLHVWSEGEQIRNARTFL